MLSGVIHGAAPLQKLPNGIAEGCTEVHRLCSKTGKFQTIYQSSCSSHFKTGGKNNLEEEKKRNLYPERLINNTGVGELLALLGLQSIFVTVQKASGCFGM